MCATRTNGLGLGNWLNDFKPRYCLSMRVTPTVHAEPEDYEEYPTYRVNFWQSGPGQVSFNLEAFVVSGALDVNQVKEWIHDHAAGRSYELFVEVDGTVPDDYRKPRVAALIRLEGRDPNMGEMTEIGRFIPE